MFDPKRYILAGATVVVALGIGFVMQQAPSPVTQTASLDSQMDITILPPVESSAMSGLDLSQFAHTAATSRTGGLDRSAPDLPEPDVDMAAAVPGLDEGVTVTDAPLDRPQVADCDPVITATPAPAAMVDLMVSAQCLPQARVTIHHNGMMVQALTDAQGTLRMRAPALAHEALFIASFENGTGAVARAQVPDFDAYQRVVLQWRGDAGFQIHALEYGATYGDAGHIWHDAPGDPNRVIAGQGGALTSLGDLALPDGLRAEVYTFPTGVAQTGEVVLTAEAVITPANCTRDVQAQALQVGAGGVLTAQELTLTMPSCEVEGDILMLKNLLQDLKIARN